MEALRKKASLCKDLEGELSALAAEQASTNKAGGRVATEVETRSSKLRTDLCELYCDILLTDSVFALRRDIHGRLWKNCFYARINELRTRVSRENARLKRSITKKDKEGAELRRKGVEGVERTLGGFLKEAISLYEYLVDKYEKKLLQLCGVEDGQGKRQRGRDTGSGAAVSGVGSSGKRKLFDPNAAAEPPPQLSQQSRSDGSNKKKADDSASNAAIVPILFRLLLSLGDLKRYASEHDGATDCYLKASKLAPGLGNPYNQLAVVAQIAGGSDQNRSSSSPAQPLTAVALYWYARSLLARDEPFATSRTNLQRLFAANRQWIEKNPDASDAQNSEEATKSLDANDWPTIADAATASTRRTASTPEPMELSMSQSQATVQSQASRSVSSSRSGSKKAQLEATRAAKSAASRRFLATFVDFQWDLYRMAEAERTGRGSLTPMVSNTTERKALLSSSKILFKMKLMVDSLEYLLSVAAFSDSLLLKLVCINAFSYYNALHSDDITHHGEEDKSDLSDGMYADEARILSATFILSFGSSLAKQVIKSLGKLKKGSSGGSKQAQQQVSIRVLSPLVAICDLVSLFYGDPKDDQSFGERSRGKSLELPLYLRCEKIGSGEVDQGFLAAEVEFWRRVSQVANRIFGIDKFVSIVDISRMGGEQDHLPLPKEYSDLHGYSPLERIFPWPGSDSTDQMSNYVLPHQAIAQLDLQQSQTKQQKSSSSRKSKEDGAANDAAKSTAESISRVARFLLIVQRHTIAPENGAALKRHGHYLLFENIGCGKLTSMLEEDEDDDANATNYDFEIEPGVPPETLNPPEKLPPPTALTPVVPAIPADEKAKDENPTETGDLLVYRKGAGEGPALLVPSFLVESRANSKLSTYESGPILPGAAKPLSTAHSAGATDIRSEVLPVKPPPQSHIADVSGIAYLSGTRQPCSLPAPPPGFSETSSGPAAAPTMRTNIGVPVWERNDVPSQSGVPGTNQRDQGQQRLFTTGVSLGDYQNLFGNSMVGSIVESETPTRATTLGLQTGNPFFSTPQQHQQNSATGIGQNSLASNGIGIFGRSYDDIFGEQEHDEDTRNPFY